jgi:hypothetical protein
MRVCTAPEDQTVDVVSGTRVLEAKILDLTSAIRQPHKHAAETRAVRIHVDQVPDGVHLVAGMTATVQIVLDPSRERDVRRDWAMTGP